MFQDKTNKQLVSELTFQLDQTKGFIENSNSKYTLLTHIIICFHIIILLIFYKIFFFIYIYINMCLIIYLLSTCIVVK
jgi:hypothetical protein